MGEIERHQCHHQENEQSRPEEPDQRHDQLGPDELVHAHRQGKHQVPLILQQVPVKAAYHDHKGHHRRGNHGNAEKDDDQDKEDPEQRHIRQISGESPDGEIGQQRQGHHRPHHRQHDPRGCSEFMLHQFP